MGAVIRVMVVVNVIALVAFVYGLSLAPPPRPRHRCSAQRCLEHRSADGPVDRDGGVAAMRPPLASEERACLPRGCEVRSRPG